MRYALMLLFWGCLAVGVQAAVLEPCQLAGGASNCSSTELNIGQLWTLIQQRVALGLPTSAQWTDLHLKFALPLATFFTTLLVAPLGVTLGKRGSAVAVSASLALVFGWQMLYSIFAPLGRLGTLPPFWGAWVQNVLFGAIGLGLLLWMERDRWLYRWG